MVACTKTECHNHSLKFHVQAQKRTAAKYNSCKAAIIQYRKLLYHRHNRVVQREVVVGNGHLIAAWWWCLIVIVISLSDIIVMFADENRNQGPPAAAKVFYGIAMNVKPNKITRLYHRSINIF